MSGTGGGPRGVTGIMATSHDAMEDLLLDVRDAVDDGDFAAAATAFGTFDVAQRKHMQLEDELLLPLLDARTPELGPAIAMTRAEHIFVLAVLGAMGAAIASRDTPEFRHTFEHLGRVLPAHEAREARLLYPALERVLDGEERAALVARINGRL